MVNKSSYVLAFFAMIFLAVSFASASITFTPVSIFPSTLNNSQSYTFYFNVSTNESDLTLVSFNAAPSASSYAWVKPSAILINSTNGTVQVSYSLTISSTMTTGAETFNFSASNGTIINSSSFSAAIQNKPSVVVSNNFCRFGNVGQNLSITDVSISNNGEGEDDEWFLLDDVEIDVDVLNEGDKKISSVYVELAIYSGSSDVTDDFDLSEEKISLGSISSDDEETATFVINEVPADISDGDYTIKIKTYVSGDEDRECEDYSDSVQVTNPFGEGVIVYGDPIEGQIEANAGDTLDLNIDVINLGSDKEDEVLIVLYNKELGINAKYNLHDLKSADTELASFLLDLPTGIPAKTYYVDVKTYFDYDDGEVSDKNSYDQNSAEDLEDDYDSFSFGIKIIGGDTVDPTKPTISANLNSSAVVGEDLVVAVTFKNNGNTSVSAILAPEDYESWAELVSVEPATITVGRAESKTVYMTFKPSKEGQQTFNLNAIYSGKSVDQLVTVRVDANTSWMSSIKEQFGTVGAYLIVGIVVLVALIILVLLIKLIVSLVRKH